MVNQGISAILNTDEEIHLPSEMAATERKLYDVKAELKQRTLEAQLAEKRKNELVMYLAHDIRTPLTSVIGYLNLLSEAPDMPAEQRAKYVGITLDKAYRLEKMVNEFFEITRYNFQQIDINKETIDLYYMLVQIIDEMSPVLSSNGNTAILRADENLTVYGDPDKLARVFNNVLKNAAAYSFPGTEILITGCENEYSILISIENKGKTIPKDKLAVIFEKFYRLDESRMSNTGGSGLSTVKNAAFFFLLFALAIEIFNGCMMLFRNICQCHIIQNLFRPGRFCRFIVPTFIFNNVHCLLQFLHLFTKAVTLFIDDTESFIQRRVPFQSTFYIATYIFNRHSCTFQTGNHFQPSKVCVGKNTDATAGTRNKRKQTFLVIITNGRWCYIKNPGNFTYCIYHKISPIFFS